MTPANKEPIAMTANRMALAALDTSALAPPPAPIPFRAPNIPGQVKAVEATIKAENMVDRYHVTGCFSSGEDMAGRGICWRVWASYVPKTALKEETDEETAREEAYFLV